MCVCFFFNVNSVVTKSGICTFFNPICHCACIPLALIVMQTHSNSAHTLPDDGYNDMYVDDHAISPVEAGTSRDCHG